MEEVAADRLQKKYFSDDNDIFDGNAREIFSDLMFFVLIEIIPPYPQETLPLSWGLGSVLIAGDISRASSGISPRDPPA